MTWPRRQGLELRKIGHVFVDRNGNGIRDENEPGVAGVAVLQHISE